MQKARANSRASHRSLGRPEGSSGVKTRARLLQIAAGLFADNGFAGVTMADVAGAADLTAPSIYNHFSSKDELFVATVTHMYTEIAAGFAQAAEAAGCWNDKVLGILDAAANLYREDRVLQRLGAVAHLEASQNPQRFEAILAAQDEVDQVFRDVAAEALAQGDLPPATDPDVAGELLAAMIMMAIAKVTMTRSSKNEFGEIVQTFSALFLPDAADQSPGAHRW